MSVKHAILTLLSKSPRHRYDLKVSFESMVHKQWNLNPGQIYTTIDRLIRDGLVQEAQDEKAELKKYHITEKGLKEVHHWLMEPVQMSLLHNEFFFKFLCAQELDFNQLSQMIKQQKELIITNILQLQLLRKSIDYNKKNEAIHYLIDGEILHLEADMKWLDMFPETKK